MDKIGILVLIGIFGYLFYQALSEPEPPPKAKIAVQHGYVLNARKKYRQEQPIKLVTYGFFLLMLILGFCQIMEN